MLTYAGEELLFPNNLMDPPGLLDQWIADNQDLADLSQFSFQEPRIASGRHIQIQRNEQTKGVGLPILNWPAPPPPRLNTIWWPTGATRWARAYFLVTRKTRDKIITKCHKDGLLTKQPLKWGDDSGEDENTPDPLEADMFLLAPRPVTCVNTDDDLWLLPLVDERYFWQFNDSGNIALDSTSTWDDLFEEIKGYLNLDELDWATVPSAYLKPSLDEFNRPFFNAALLLDAAASSVGQRVVRKLDGSVVLQDYAAGKDVLDEDFAESWRPLAGGQFSSLSGEVPNSVRAVFRSNRSSLLFSNELCRSIRYFWNLAAVHPAVVAPTGTLTVRCAAIADCTNCTPLSGTPANNTALDNLTKQIRDDFYAWNSKDYDTTYAGVVPWALSGFDDAVIWVFGRLQAPRELPAQAREPQSFTRVQTLPSNFWPEVNACSDSSVEIVGGPKAFTVNTVDAGSGLAHHAFVVFNTRYTDDRSYKYAKEVEVSGDYAATQAGVPKDGLYEFWLCVTPNHAAGASLDVTLAAYRAGTADTDGSTATALSAYTQTVAVATGVKGPMMLLHGLVFLQAQEKLMFRTSYSDASKTVNFPGVLYIRSDSDIPSADAQP